MAEADMVIEELAAPARNAAVSAILASIAAEIDRGAEVIPEPELRDAAGRVARSGPLNLPRRADLAVIRDGRRLHRRIDSGPPPPGDAVVLATEDGFVAEIGPFRWDTAQLMVLSQQSQPDWAPLRRWFLEWFQSRHSEVAPELLGAVHSLDGPRRNGRGWLFTLDLGSAPASCLGDLIAALAASGAARMRLGHE